MFRAWFLGLRVATPRGLKNVFWGSVCAIFSLLEAIARAQRSFRIKSDFAGLRCTRKNQEQGHLEDRHG